MEEFLPKPIIARYPVTGSFSEPRERTVDETPSVQGDTFTGSPVEEDIGLFSGAWAVLKAAFIPGSDLPDHIANSSVAEFAAAHENELRFGAGIMGAVGKEAAMRAVGPIAAPFVGTAYDAVIDIGTGKGFNGEKTALGFATNLLPLGLRSLSTVKQVALGTGLTLATAAADGELTPGELVGTLVGGGGSLLPTGTNTIDLFQVIRESSSKL